MPTKCPVCTGDIIYGPSDSERSDYAKAAKWLAVIGAVIGFFIDLDGSIGIGPFWGTILGGVGGYLFLYFLPQKG
jgi:uncharacterized protein YqgC (DUF456 family)